MSGATIVLHIHGELCNLDILFNYLIHVEIRPCAIFCILKKKAAMCRSHAVVCTLSQLSVPFIRRPPRAFDGSEEAAG